MNGPETCCDLSERGGRGDLDLGLRMAMPMYSTVGNGDALRVKGCANAVSFVAPLARSSLYIAI